MELHLSHRTLSLLPYRTEGNLKPDNDTFGQRRYCPVFRTMINDKAWIAIRKSRVFYGYLVIVLYACCTFSMAIAEDLTFDHSSVEKLALPVLLDGPPTIGKRVKLTAPEYVGTEVFHTLFLPQDWTPDGPALPIIFEYTGNYFPTSGSTGKVEDAGLGFGLSGGKYIWVSLPYINEQGTANEIRWWGDENATIQYAKQNVPRIIKRFNADSNAVFLCGFSRGAIGVNYIGLADDEIAGLWTAFITHDHFDGARAWNTPWGSPLEQYRTEARKRLERVGDRRYWVSQNGKNDSSERFIRSALDDTSLFTFEYINVGEILGPFPNDVSKAPHTDRWPLVPSEARSRVRQWLNQVIESTRINDRHFNTHIPLNN